MIGYYRSRLMGLVKYDPADCEAFDGWAEIVYGDGKMLSGFIRVSGRASGTGMSLAPLLE